MKRGSVLAAVGVLAGGALALGVAAPANAVDVAPLSSYMLTVPPSVYSASAGYSAAEQSTWRDIARVGVDPKPPTVPVSPGMSWGIVGGIQALWLGGSFIVENAGTFGTVLGVSPQQLQDRYAEQGLTAAEGFQCESLEGDFLGDLVTGVNDWFQSLFGVDCAALRDGELEKNPAWEPLLVTDPAGPTPFPITLGGVTFGKPIWSDTRVVITTPRDRVEGWIIPVSGTYNSSAFPQWTAQVVGPNGVIDNGSVSGAFTGSITGSRRSTSPLCPASANFGCYVVDALMSTTTGLEVSPGVAYNWLTPEQYPYAVGSFQQMRVFGSSGWTPMKPLPYVSPALGSTGYVDPGEEVVFLTTVETGDGNRFQCRTAPFLETDVDVPTPCEPTIPGDEWVATRTVEMIPASTPNGNWVVGSDPRRVMTEQESPQEYRDWKTAYPMCGDIVCKMDLIKNGLGSCFQLGDACDGWAADPNRASAYTCTYNGSSIALSECEAGYPNVFNQQARDLGQAYPQPTDPATGQPSTGGQTSTVAGPVVAPGSWPSNPEQPRNCFPTGWNAFNPFEWVYKPVKCAWEWAMVPRQSYVNSIAGNMRAVWTGSSLVSLLGVLEDGSEVMFGPQGCEGPPVDLTIYGGSYSGHPFSACGEFAQAASITSTVTGIAAWLFASLSIGRSVAGVVAFRGLGGGDDE